jgi:uncharacterized protein YkwD
MPRGHRPVPRPVFAVLGSLLAVALAAGATAQEAPPPTHEPPPLAAPVIVPPDEDEAPPGPRSIHAFSGAVATFEERVLEIVNQERLDNGGLPPLKGQAQLTSAAEGHSFNMADRNFFSHCDPDNLPTQTLGLRLAAAGYSFNVAGENIGGGYTSPEDVMTTWMASSGHRDNILSTNYRELGIGYVSQPGDQANVRVDLNSDCATDFIDGPYVHYWTQDFGRRNSVYPVVIEREAHDTLCAAVDLYVYAPVGADEMRFSNDESTWSAWMPYAPDATWTLAGSAGNTTTVFAEVRNGAPSEAQDDIYLASGFPAPDDLDLDFEFVNTTETYVACDTITAEEFTVGGSGDVTFDAGQRIILRDGFAVEAGGKFTARVGSP